MVRNFTEPSYQYSLVTNKESTGKFIQLKVLPKNIPVLHM